MNPFVFFVFLDIITTFDGQFYEIDIIEDANKTQTLVDTKNVILDKETLDVGSEDNVSIEIIGDRLSFLEETSSTLHSFRLVHEENQTTFVHTTVYMPDGSYPRTYTEFKESVWYTEAEIDDRNSVYRDKNFILFFVEEKGFLKFPSGKYTPKLTEQESFSIIELELLDISTKAFFNRKNDFCVLGVELFGFATVLRVDGASILYGVFYLDIYNFFEENNFFKPHPNYVHLVLTQKVEIGKIGIEDVFIVDLIELIYLKLQFSFKDENLVLKIVEIPYFLEIQEKPFRFYDFYSVYNSENSFPVELFEASVPGSSLGFGFLFYPSSVYFDILCTDFFAFVVIINLTFETSDGIFSTNQIPVYVEIFNRTLILLSTMVFKNHKIGNWLATIEFTMKNRFYGKNNSGMQVDFSVTKVFIENVEATIYKVDNYGVGGLTIKQETINNPNSISYKVIETLSLQVSSSRLLILMHNKHQKKYEILLQNNKEFAKECNKLRQKVEEKNKIIQTLHERIDELNSSDSAAEEPND